MRRKNTMGHAAMTSAQSVLDRSEGEGEVGRARAALAEARSTYYERPEHALELAIRCHELGRCAGDDSLCARGRALQGAVSLHRGDLPSALQLAVDAERYAEVSGDLVANAEVTGLKAQLCFFTGSYGEAVGNAERAVKLADQTGDLDLSINTRRATCMVFGNLQDDGLTTRVEELLELTLRSGNAWEEAISRNDRACNLQERGELELAEREIERALEAAARVNGPNSFALAVIYSSRADIRLLAGRPGEALEDAERSLDLLTTFGDPNPYIFAATVRAAVEARMALGELDDAQESGEHALAWLGDRLPQTRSLILSTIATALRAAGRFEEAYDALAEAAELERQAFRELSELRLSLERADLEIRTARQERDALAAKNTELAEAHSELERRAGQLEQLQEQLRDQAERDYLTGLRNRRFLAREVDRLSDAQHSGPLSLAVLDLDHFKSINDRFGHDVGDRVLVRVAALLSEVLRASDMVVRSGGEEFLLLMPMTEPHAARVCCERLRRAIQDEPWNALAPELSLTASIGIATGDGPDDLAALAKLADQRLYDAKHAGRDRVVGDDALAAA
jgi:diguanylate cyclase (GGDEF)-like protein